jgi:hypothetical protein
LNINPTFEPMWKNRIQLDFQVLTEWNISLLQNTNSQLTFNINFSFSVHEFIKITFALESENTEMYRYFEGPADAVGFERRSFLQDLWWSLDIFNAENRENTLFNAKSISLSIVHNLRDWDLHIDYSGNPVLRDDEEGIQYYKWDWTLSFFIQWNPIPEIKREVKANDEKIVY